MSNISTIFAVSAGSAEQANSLLEKISGEGFRKDTEGSGGALSDSGLMGIGAESADSGGFYHDPENGIAVAFSGRITNSAELADKVAADGNKPLADRFAELSGRLFLRFGIGFLEMLHGYFSIIMMDEKNGRLFACRDHSGFMPLFYSTGRDGKTGIASRVEPLIETGAASSDLDLQAIFYFLCDKAFVDGETPFKEIRGVKAGEYIIVGSDGVHTERYYKTPIKRKPMSEKEAIDEADTLIREILSEQISHFDRIGLLFSGGVDSMLLLSAVRDLTDKPIHTYSVSVESAGKDNEYIKKASEHFGTTHTDVTLDDSAFRDNILPLISSFPTPAVGAWHVYLGSKAAGNDGVKGLICGFGGELVFGISSVNRYLEKLHRILGFLNGRRALDSVLLRAIGSLGSLLSRIYPPAGLVKSYTGLRVDGQRWYDSMFSEKRVAGLMSADSGGFRRVREKYLDDYSESGTEDLTDMLLYARMKNFEGNKVLGKCNEIARLNGTELLVPFMDRRMVEFGFSIPHGVKTTDGRFRYVEAQVAARYHNFERDKSAFMAPFEDWMRNVLPKEAEMAFDPAHSAKLGIFKPDELEALWLRFKNEESELSWADIFTLISIHYWLDSVLS